jgi:hypothetical protein
LCSELGERETRHFRLVLRVEEERVDGGEQLVVVDCRRRSIALGRLRVQRRHRLRARAPKRRRRVRQVVLVGVRVVRAECGRFQIVLGQCGRSATRRSYGRRRRFICAAHRFRNSSSTLTKTMTVSCFRFLFSCCIILLCLCTRRLAAQDEDDEHPQAGEPVDIFGTSSSMVIDHGNEFWGVDDHFMCAACHAPLASRLDLVHIESSLELDAGENLTVWASHPPLLLQAFSNGFKEFELLTFARAKVRPVSPPSAENTWWPGWRWQIAQCACGEHLGWAFTIDHTAWRGSGLPRGPPSFVALDFAALEIFDDILQLAEPDT